MVKVKEELGKIGSLSSRLDRLKTTSDDEFAKINSIQRQHRADIKKTD